MGWYYMIRPGGTGADTVYDKLLLYGRYGGTEGGGGSAVDCMGNVPDHNAFFPMPLLNVDIGEPINPINLARSYDSLIAESTWTDFRDSTAPTGFVFAERKYLKGSDTNLAVFRIEGPQVVSAIDSSTWSTLDTFNLGQLYYRVYPNGDTASPVNSASPGPDSFLVLFGNDGAILLAPGQVTPAAPPTPPTLDGGYYQGGFIGYKEDDNGRYETFGLLHPGRYSFRDFDCWDR